MGLNKKHWLVYLLMLVAIAYLAPANCGHKTANKESPSTEAKECELPHNIPDCRPTSSNDERKVDAGVGRDDEAKNESMPNASRSCETAEDCGCSYECVDSQCRKIVSSCCANADCKTSEFCSDHNDELAGTCMPWQCDTDNHCNRCGMYCRNHLCVQEHCCATADCPTGELCDIFSNEEKEGYCRKPKCVSDADCSCGLFCDKWNYSCDKWKWNSDANNQDTRKNPCCGNDVFYERACYSHEYVEDGNCLGDEHCQTGKVCIVRKCYPETCANNADCGCEAVCRKGRCELGCDDNSGCCNEGHICDRGECINPNAEEGEEDE